jgi:hypothetical protein
MPLSGLELSADSPENSGIPTTADAESDADSANSSPSPALSMLAKLFTGLTVDERAALARMLQQAEGVPLTQALVPPAPPVRM